MLIFFGTEDGQTHLVDSGARHFAWINGGELLQPSAKARS